jgi:DNA-binding transcriptional LysR family regulator
LHKNWALDERRHAIATAGIRPFVRYFNGLLDDWHVEAITIHLLTPPGRTRPARVQALVDYLCEHFANVPWAWHGSPTV